MKQIFLGMMSLVVMVSCTNEIDLSSYEAVPEATRSSKERVYDDCSVDGDNLSLLLTMTDKGFESSFNCYGVRRARSIRFSIWKMLTDR
jgi:hypothetical protein